MVFHGADHIAAAGKKFEGRGVERLDPTGIDDCCGNAEFFKFLCGGDGEFAHVAEGEDCSLGAVSNDFGFSDLKELWLFGGNGASSYAARVADGAWTVVVHHCPKHVGEFRLVLGLHVNDSWDWAQVGDVE